jgi:uncharacterized protein YdhG (YjbR/CyaY superfamily)
MATETKTKTAGWSQAEKSAAQARVKELKAEAKRGADREAALRDCLAAIAGMPSGDRELAQQVHEIITKNAPHLQAKTWYGMPAYANDSGTVAWFKPSSKFKDHYSTLGFEKASKLDEGNFWPNAYAIVELTPADEKQIAAIVKKAAS